MERSRADSILGEWDTISGQMSRPGLPQRHEITTALPVSTIAAAALLVVVAVAGGFRLGFPPGTGLPGAEASASPAEASPSSVEPSASTVGASPLPAEASPSPEDPWGPLAVLPSQDGMDTLRAEGVLRITDSCVYLESSNVGQILLFWHADQATWNEDSRALSFRNLDGRVVILSNGDHVVVGGSGGGKGDGESGEEFVTRMDWVAPPASSCMLDPWWSVGEVEN